MIYGSIWDPKCGRFAFFFKGSIRVELIENQAQRTLVKEFRVSFFQTSGVYSKASCGVLTMIADSRQYQTNKRISTATIAEENTTADSESYVAQHFLGHINASPYPVRPDLKKTNINCQIEVYVGPTSSSRILHITSDAYR